MVRVLKMFTDEDVFIVVSEKLFWHKSLNLCFINLKRNIYLFIFLFIFFLNEKKKIFLEKKYFALAAPKIGYLLIITQSIQM